MSEQTSTPRDAANWARKPKTLKVGALPPEAVGPTRTGKPSSPFLVVLFVSSANTSTSPLVEAITCRRSAVNLRPKNVVLMTLFLTLLSAGTLAGCGLTPSPTSRGIPGASGQHSAPLSRACAMVTWLFDTARGYGVDGRLSALIDRVNDLITPDGAVRPVSIRLAVSSSVPAQASAAGGAITPDDLLVAAPEGGYVMRAPAQAAAHAIVGQARGRLICGTGVITIQETAR